MRPAVINAGGIIRCHSKVIYKQRLRRRKYSESVDISRHSLDAGESDNLEIDARTKRRLKSENKHPFKSLEEYGLLQRVFFEKSRRTVEETAFKSDKSMRKELPFVRQIRRLKEMEESRALRLSEESFSFTSNRSRTKLSQWSLEQSQFGQKLVGKGLSPENLDKIRQLMAHSNTRIISPTEIDNFLKSSMAISGDSQKNQQIMQQSLMEMIRHATTATLPALARFLQNYWQNGFEGNNEASVAAKNQLVEVLMRALEILPEAGSETGDLESASLGVYKDLFEKFISVYQWKNIDLLYDWWLRLVAKCAPIEMAEDLMYNHFILKNKLPSREATDIFIQALIRHFDAEKLSFDGTEEEFSALVKNELSAYRSLLVSSQVTPSVIQFLLLWCSDLDEVYSVLETASKSEHSDWIMSTCQVPMVRAVVHCTLNAEKQGPEHPAIVDPTYFVPIHAKAMAHMFGVLNRFDKSGAGITPEVLDECLLLSAKYGNSAGMYRAISMRLGLSSEIPADVISQVFDHFPVSSGAMAKEAQKSSLWIINGTVVSDTRRDQVILYHLRTMIDMNTDRNSYKKYIGALGRCARSDRLGFEWAEYITNESWMDDLDLLLEFISAHKAAGSTDRGIEILEDVFEAGTEKRYIPAVKVIRQVLRYGVLPVQIAVKEISSIFLKNRSVLSKWLNEDIDAVVDEMTIPTEMKRDLIKLLKSHDIEGDTGEMALENILHNHVY